MLWTNSDSRDAVLGSDESLGGALLTPIPWLRNGERADTMSPKSDPLGQSNVLGNSFVPERHDGGVTQGELIRMEQEAGIVAVSQTIDDGEGETEDEGADVVPHARGPDVVGVEDMGLQDGKDVELQIGKGSPKAGQVIMGEPKPGPVPGAVPGVDDVMTTREKKGSVMPTNGDGDIVLSDADGKTEESEPKAGTSGENVGPDSGDTSAH